MRVHNSFFVLAFSLATFTIGSLHALPIKESISTGPVCDNPGPQKRCESEGFYGMANNPMYQGMRSFTSPEGFYFQHTGNSPPMSTGQMTIQDVNGSGDYLYFNCYSAVMIPPVERQEITFLFGGRPAAINFVAYDRSGNIVDSKTVDSNNLRGETFVRLGSAQSSSRISYVIMYHVQSDVSCELDCGEPFIGHIEACDYR